MLSTNSFDVCGGVSNMPSSITCAEPHRVPARLRDKWRIVLPLNTKSPVDQGVGIPRGIGSMNQLKMVVVLLVGLVLCACSRIQEAAMPATEKINEAYPVVAEVKLSRERLTSLLAGDAKAQKELGTTIDAQMTLRALSCAKGQSIGRLDSVASVRQLHLDPVCFQQQDQELMTLFGIRTIGVMLAKAALRPRQAIGAEKLLPVDKTEGVSQVVVANEANVAVLVDNKSKGTVVQLPGGEVIAKLSGLGSTGGQGLRLSPNGRVVVRQAEGYASTFLDAETGQPIWSTSDTELGRFLAWLPGVGSWLLSDRQGGVSLADGVRGVVAPQPISVKNTSYAVTIPGSKPRLLMGSSNSLVLVEHAREDKGVATVEVAHFTLSADTAITSSAPVSMMGGRMVVYTSGRDMAWLDLDSGKTGSWRITPFFLNSFAKLDEQHVLMDSFAMLGRKSSAWLMDVSKQTVAPVGDGMDKGLLMPFGAREGYFRRGSDTLLGDKVDAVGAAQDLSALVGEYDLQLQMAKVEAASRQGADVASSGAWPGSSRGDDGGLPALPGLLRVPLDAEVHIVGVYESKNRSSSPLRVTLKRSARPIVLVLTSYEAVNWQVIPAGGRLAAVLLSGYKPSTVSGAGDVPVLRIGSNYAYASDGVEYLRLRQAVVQYTRPREIRSFQGGYSGVEFAVGGNP